jgi:hypothetical protein
MPKQLNMIALDFRSTGNAKFVYSNERKMRLKIAHSRCAIPRACAPPALSGVFRAAHSRQSNSRQALEQTTIVGFEALNVHLANLQNGDRLAAMLACPSSIGGMI